MLRKLIVNTSPYLLRVVDSWIKRGNLDFAEEALSLAARWNVSPSELTRRRQQIQQIRISSLITEADKIIKQGNAKNAEQKLNAALRLGADTAKIEKIRQELPLTLAKVLIQSAKFEEAEELLVELELGGKYAGELTELYTALQKAQIQQKKAQIQSKWNGIMDLIKQKRFSTAEKEIEGWKTENSPSNLPELKKYLQQKKTEFTQNNNYKRHERVRSLIENNEFTEAKRELSQWVKTGEDKSELLKLTSLFDKRYNPSETVLDPRTGLIWQNIPFSGNASWQAASHYCRDLSLGGYSDWRLPNINVFKELFENKHKFDTFKQDSVYWSSSSAGDGYNTNKRVLYKWYMHLGSGNTGTSDSNNRYSIRCVRGRN